MNDPDISFGPVLVLDGIHKGRIGFLDDEGVELPRDIDTTLENYPDEDAEDRLIPVGYVC